MGMCLSIQNSKDAVIWADPQAGFIKDCNKAAEILLESNKNEIIGNQLLTIYPSQKAEYYGELFSKLTRGNLTVDEEAEVVSRSGTVRFVRMTSAVTVVEGEQILQGIFHDIDKNRKIADKLQESEERFKSIFEVSGIGMAFVDPEGNFQKVNKALCEIVGYSEIELLSMNFMQVVSSDAFGEGDSFKTAVGNCKIQAGAREVRCVNKKGYSLWVLLNSSPLCMANGEPLYHIVQVQNITGRKTSEEALRFSEMRYRRLFEAAQDGILILDADTGYIVDVNQYLIDMLGYSRGDFLGKKLWEIGPIKDVETSKNAFSELQSKKYIRYENLPLQTKNGTSIEVEFVSNVYGVEDHKVIQCNIRNITERRNIEKALFESKERFKNMSLHDSMTGLYNRTYFTESMARLGRDLARSAPVSIMAIDIDGLKLINDMFGHQAGDALIRAAADIIAMPFRRIDIIARLGGDEFCVILPHIDHHSALAKKNEILKLVSEHGAKNPSMHLNMSIGVATSTNDKKENIQGIYKRADEEMYACKQIHLKNNKDKVVTILLAALEERDFIKQGHAERLSIKAEAIAREMRLSDDMRHGLVLLAKVHDLGKVSVPDSILLKPGIVNDLERERVKEHSQAGYAIASRSKELFHIANLILHHHEYWDGKGYPAGLRGEQIPLECRIFSILDAYDAMTNSRPYRKGLSKKEALEELLKNKGTQFDPNIVDIFTRQN